MAKSTLTTHGASMNDPAVLYMAVEKEFGDPTRYGWTIPPPQGTHVAMCKAILAVAGADRKLSEKELVWAIGRARMFGANEEELQQIAALDWKNLSLDEAVKNIPPDARRVVLYDAIMVARSDGFGPKERAAAVKIAEKWGYGAGFVTALEAQFKAEDGVREARLHLLGPD